MRPPELQNQNERPFIGRLASGAARLSRLVQNAGLTVSDVSSIVINRTVATLQGEAKNSTIPQTVANYLEETVEVLRDARLIDPIDPDPLPKLYDDKNQDRKFKRDTTDYLDSQMSIASPFHEAIELISKRAFDQGIHPNKLIDFFETEEILDFLIHHVFTSKYTRYRGSNLAGAISSIVDSVSIKFESMASRVNKKEVAGDIEEEVLRKFRSFEKKYDPNDARRTAAEFMRRLEEKFPDYDIFNWLLKSKPLFTKLLRGHALGESKSADPKKFHVRNLIQTAYEKRAKEKGLQKEFVQLYSPYFVEHQPAKLVVEKDIYQGEKVVVAKSNIVLHLDQIALFFEKIGPKILDPATSKIHLRSMITDACLEKLFGSGALIVVAIDGEEKEEKEFYDIEEMEAYVREKIKNSTKVNRSYVELVNLLADPDSTPDELEKDYNRFYDAEGKLKTATYHKVLRRIFALVKDKDQDGTPERERMGKIKERLAKIFQESQDYLDQIHGSEKGLGIPSPNDFPEVRDCSDYSELVKLACRGETEDIRFSARRKIEIAFSEYISLYNPAFVFARHEASQIKLHLEDQQTSEGLVVDRSKPLTTIIYKNTVSDNGNGKKTAKIEIVATQDEEGGVLIDEPGLSTIEVIPAEIAGLECFLVPANNGNTNPHEYMDLKSLKSTITKMIRKRQRADTFTDYTRMTIAAKTLDDLKEILEYFDENYFNFGQRVKVEVRGFDEVELDIKDFAVETNPYKSEDLKAVRTVVMVLIPDSSGTMEYLAKFELRVGILEDLILEKNAVDPSDTGHKNYSIRRQKGVMKVIQPQALAPGLYKTVGPDPDDLWKDVDTVLKDSSDFPSTASSAPSSPETDPSS